MKNTNSNIKFLNKYEIQPRGCIITTYLFSTSIIMLELNIPNCNLWDIYGRIDVNHTTYILKESLRDRTRYKRCFFS